MKKVLIMSFLVVILVLSVSVVAQQATRRPPASKMDEKTSSAGSSASPVAKMSRPTQSKYPSGVQTSWKGPIPRLSPQTGFSRQTPKPSGRGPNIAITGKLASRALSQSSARAGFAQSSSGRRTADGSSASVTSASDRQRSAGIRGLSSGPSFGLGSTSTARAPK